MCIDLYLLLLCVCGYFMYRGFWRHYKVRRALKADCNPDTMFVHSSTLPTNGRMGFIGRLYGKDEIEVRLEEVKSVWMRTQVWATDNPPHWFTDDTQEIDIDGKFFVTEGDEFGPVVPYVLEKGLSYLIRIAFLLRNGEVISYSHWIEVL